MGSMFRFIQENLFHVAPILIVGVFAVAITIERVKALFYTYPLRNAPAFREPRTPSRSGLGGLRSFRTETRS